MLYATQCTGWPTTYRMAHHLHGATYMHMHMHMHMHMSHPTMHV